MEQLETKDICRGPSGELELATLAKTREQARELALAKQRRAIADTLERVCPTVRMPQLLWHHLLECGWRLVEVREVPDEDPVFGYPLTRLVEVGTDGRTTDNGLNGQNGPNGQNEPPRPPNRWRGVDQERRSGGMVDETTRPSKGPGSPPISRRQFFSEPAVDRPAHPRRLTPPDQGTGQATLETNNNDR